jgi:hypothetical protein
LRLDNSIFAEKNGGFSPAPLTPALIRAAKSIAGRFLP